MRINFVGTGSPYFLCKQIKVHEKKGATQVNDSYQIMIRSWDLSWEIFR